MEESFPSEHSGELFANTFEKLLDGCRVTNEGSGHLQATRRNVANSSLDVIRNPFHEVGTVLILNSKHLLIHLFHRHPSSEYSGHRQITSMSGITSCHHVLGVKHLLRQLGNSH